MSDRGRGVLADRILAATVCEHAHTSGRDHVAHGDPTAIAAMELQALHQARVGEALEPPLRGGGRTPGVEAAMKLAA